MAGRKLALILLLIVLGIALPSGWTAAALVGPGSGLLDEVTTGVWIFRAMLVVHALMLVALPRLRILSAQAASGNPLAAPPSGASAATPASSRERMLLLALLLIGGIARLVDLGDGLWFDEIQTLVEYARIPLTRILATFDSQNNHVLYSLLAHGSLATFGDGAWALRLPAALFGVASLWALHWFATQVTGRVEALVATALLTLSYHHVWFSQNARGYTGLLFFTLIASGFLLKLFTSPRDARSWRYVIGYAIATALATYTHSSALFVVAAQGLIWLTLVGRTLVRRQSLGAEVWMPLVAFVLAGTFTLQLYALVLPQFLETLTEPTMAGMSTEWKNPLWFMAETARGLARGIPGGVFVLAAAAAVGIAGVLSSWRRSGVAASIMLLPGLVTALVLLVLEHNFWPRFFFFSAGFAVMIVVRGVYALAELVLTPTPLRARAPMLATAALSLVALASATTVPTAWHPKQDFIGAREFIEKERAPGDAVVTVDMTNFPFDNYLGADWLSVQSEDELAQIERGHRRTWLLYIFPTRLSAVHPEIWARIQRGYTTVKQYPGTVGGGAVVVMVRG
jgi:mannosyltransferase